MVKGIPVTNKIAYFHITDSRSRAIEYVGGVDKVLGCRLRKLGFCTVRKLYRRTECMSRRCFLAFLKTRVNANSRQAGMAYRCLHGDVKKSVLDAKLCSIARKQERQRVCRLDKARSARSARKFYAKRVARGNILNVKSNANEDVGAKTEHLPEIIQ